MIFLRHRLTGRPGRQTNIEEIMTEKAKTYAEIAADFNLWGEYVDTSALTTREEFDAQTIAEKIEFITKCFGTDPTVA